MQYTTRKLVMPRDLNANDSLFGGRMLEWCDEEAAIVALSMLPPNSSVVTASIAKIDFKSSAYQGEIVEIGVDLISVGTTSMTFKCSARNLTTKCEIVTIDQIVFVNVIRGKPHPHGLQKIEKM